ncbi:hypothetical protein GCK72_000903 [Caenorhabditis remanei]|uniref:C2H2-type domain-containing protein n=1 Tax=Caenorhabditis remanei TaxID=31234 RepID=A0A6A5HLL4_CAERE|nr:hypothetical protein GCK72_000903 [Caenorhabditis remanei]KAF1769090.1 hypothetical protein GCK72_000903 [Caenorhabditis remanei]
MIGYPIVFRCCECTVEEQTMEHLESHIWSRHLQAFPFKCAHCDFPALSAISLMEHFEQNHAEVTTVEFKRNLDDEKRFRKMVAESIAIEIEDTSQQDAGVQMDSIQPMMQQGPRQIMLLPPQTSRYQDIDDSPEPEDNDFGVMEDDENVEELIEDDEDDDYIDELGNPVFIGAHDDNNFILDDEISQQGGCNMRGNSFHLKYIRTRRMDKLIDNVVVNAAQRTSPDSVKPVNLYTEISCFTVFQTINPTNGEGHYVDGRGGRKVGRYQCDQCPRSFKYQSKLDEHRRTHLGVRPFNCPYCDQSFTQKGALKTHMRTHTGERPFYCQWDCGKQFISSSARRHHEKTHSGERPYICSVCGKGFTKNSHNIHNREIIQRDSMLQGGMRSPEITVSEATGEIVDIQPRGKEISVVRDIVEQIHEEKFSERKDFLRI